MLLVQVCSLPADSEGELNELCRFWFSRLADRLDEQQLNYMAKWRRTKFGFRAFASRLLARLMLLSMFSPMQKLYSDARGLPTLNNKKYASSFAYSDSLALCAFYAPAMLSPAIRFAADIEAFNKNFAADGHKKEGSFLTLRHLKNWLKYEIAVKTASNKSFLAWVPAIDKKRKTDFPTGNLHHKFFAIPGHIVCIGANMALPQKILFRYKHAFQI